MDSVQYICQLSDTKNLFLIHVPVKWNKTCLIHERWVGLSKTSTCVIEQSEAVSSCKQYVTVIQVLPHNKNRTSPLQTPTSEHCSRVLAMFIVRVIRSTQTEAKNVVVGMLIHVGAHKLCILNVWSCLQQFIRKIFVLHELIRIFFIWLVQAETGALHTGLSPHPTSLTLGSASGRPYVRSRMPMEYTLIGAQRTSLRSCTYPVDRTVDSHTVCWLAYIPTGTTHYLPRISATNLLSPTVVR